MTLFTIIFSTILALTNSAMASSQKVVFTGQPTEKLQMISEISHEVYEDQDYQDTCYRDVLDGYDRVCRDTSRRECTPITRRECTDTTRRECTPITRRECTNEQECRDVRDEVCRTTPSREECHTVSRRECSTRNECRDVRDEVCRTDRNGNRVCTPINRRECNPVNECRDVPDRVCRTIPGDRVCEPVYRRECNTVPRCRDVSDTVCRDIPDRVCRDVNDEVCRDIPDQICEDVPRYRNEAYSCTKTRRVLVGVEKDFDVRSDIDVDFSALPAGVVANEEFEAVLDQENFTFKLVKSSKALILLAKVDVVSVIDQPQTPQAPGIKTIKGRVTVTALTPDQFLYPLKNGISNITMTSAKIGFTTGRETPDILRVVTRAKIVRVKTNGAKVVVHDDLLARTSITVTDKGNDQSDFVSDLAKVGISSAIVRGNYEVTVRLSALKASMDAVLNQDLIQSLNIQPLIKTVTITVP